MRDELTGGLDDAARNSYPKKKWISEGIAEYFRKYLQNREVAAIDYPAFTAYIKNLLPAKDMAQLDQLADEVNAYYSLDADTATSSVRLREEGRPDARTLRREDQGECRRALSGVGRQQPRHQAL